MTGRAGLRQLGRICRFHADHLRVGCTQLDGGGKACTQSPTAHGHQHGAHVGEVIDDLQARRALAGNDPRMIVWRHHRESLRLHQCLGAFVAILRRGAREFNARAEPLRTAALGRRHRGGHDHHGLAPEQPGRERNGLRVVAGRWRNHPACTLGGGKLREKVIGAAELERPPALEHFWLDPHLRTELLGQCIHGKQRCSHGDRGDTGSRSREVGQGNQRGHVRGVQAKIRLRPPLFAL